jgi:hypothetical protein
VPDPFLRIDHDHDDIVNFCSRNNHPIPWTPEMLKDCVVVRAFDDEGTIGFFLGHWYLEPGLMYLHVCIDEGRRARWFRPSVLKQLYQLAFSLGADELLVSLKDIPLAPRIRPLLLIAGFREQIVDEGDDVLFILNLWEFPWDHTTPPKSRRP